jgi:2-keto-4-pentenoate hydratase
LNLPIHDGAARVAQALVRARSEHRTESAALLQGCLRDAADAYAAQRLASEAFTKLRPGSPPVWKSGGAGREVALTHAALPAGGVWRSPADARGHHFNFRFIEAEVALRLARDVTPQAAAALTHEEGPSLLDAMTVSIEIVDFRWTETMNAPALFKLADLQSHGALVLGPWIAYQARDWAAQHCEVRIGGASHEFTGTHALGDPAWLLPLWLRHATRSGATMPAGSAVTTGTWCGLLPAQAGDQVRVTFAGIGEANVQL